MIISCVYQFNVAILLKMGNISNSFLGVVSVVTNKASQGCLNFFEGCSITPLGCFTTPLTIGKEESEQPFQH